MLGMPWRRPIERRPAFQAEMPRQLIAAVAGLGKALGASLDDAEASCRDAHADVEGAPGTTPTICAMAIIGRPDLTVIFVAHPAAQASAGHLSAHGVLHRQREGGVALRTPLCDTVPNE